MLVHKFSLEVQIFGYVYTNICVYIMVCVNFFLVYTIFSSK